MERGENDRPSPEKADHDVWAENLKTARLAEELGFGSLWTIEHRVAPYAMTPNPVQLLSYWAGALKQIDLGTMVSVESTRDKIPHRSSNRIDRLRRSKNPAAIAHLPWRGRATVLEVNSRGRVAHTIILPKPAVSSPKPIALTRTGCGGSVSNLSPRPRLCPAESDQGLQDLVRRRQQLVSMITAESNRRQQATILRSATASDASCAALSGKKSPSSMRSRAGSSSSPRSG
jgi:hypothetical protein